MKIDVHQADMTVPASDSEVLPDVLQAANQQIQRVQQLSELREKQIQMVSQQGKSLLVSRSLGDQK